MARRSWHKHDLDFIESDLCDWDLIRIVETLLDADSIAIRSLIFVSSEVQIVIGIGSTAFLEAQNRDNSGTLVNSTFAQARVQQ